jgi:hypothetical protein
MFRRIPSLWGVAVAWEFWTMSSTKSEMCWRKGAAASLSSRSSVAALVPDTRFYAVSVTRAQLFFLGTN